MRDEDNKPAVRPAYVIGQDLSLLSVSELEATMALLQTEIGRLGAERDKRDRTRAAAEAIFGR